MSNTIYIVTPSFNSEETIDRTLLSVFSQAGNFYIRYHVQDGGSCDKTVMKLQGWLEKLQNGDFPIQCFGIGFTYASESDAGMYDAIVKGVSSLKAASDGFVAWINSDDVYQQGAFQHIAEIGRQFEPKQVSWVGGLTSVFRGSNPVSTFDNPIPNFIVKNGLADGVNWNYLQQEGVFFRYWLWKAVCAQEILPRYKFAGDWNLWRLFSSKASLIQTKITLGVFCITKGQLSEKFCSEYLDEINSTVSLDMRNSAFDSIPSCINDLDRRFIKINYSDGRLSVHTENCHRQYSANYRKKFGSYPKLPLIADKTSALFQGVLVDSAMSQNFDDVYIADSNIYAFNSEWQFPAITELHAYRKIKELINVDGDFIYVAYPWATLIDKVQTKAPDAYIHIINFKRFCKLLPRGKHRITVCQHIKMLHHLDFIRMAEINDVFWSHANNSTECLDDKLSIYPFPLYPVQVVDQGTFTTRPVKDRRWLFSFIGARSNKYYLTRSREWIIDRLSNVSDALVVGRDNWHYNKVVYEHQIRPDLIKNNSDLALVNENASIEFKEALYDSVFALCPSGTGPNSIRLWEALGAGTIPVLLADSYLPPGNMNLWREAVVFCKEDVDSISELPAILRSIFNDKLKLSSMQNACRQLWMLYGYDSFITDIDLRIRSGVLMSEMRNSASVESVPSFFDVYARDIANVEQARNVIQLYDTSLLLGSLSSDFVNVSSPLVAESVRRAIELLDDDLLVSHHNKVSSYVLARGDAQYLAINSVSSKRKTRVAFIGRHSNRTPLSYSVFRTLAEDRLNFTSDLYSADIIITGFNIDLMDNYLWVFDILKRNPRVKFFVVSEEPLWDVLWSGGVEERSRSIETPNGLVQYIHLNHQNSSIFDFDVLPYFVLTDNRYSVRYSHLMSRFLQMQPSNMVDLWSAAPLRSAFYAEKRNSDNYVIDYPALDIWSLSVYRTKLAQQLKSNKVVCRGKGWDESCIRQSLPDWHLDKLANLDRQIVLSSSLENTHQVNYISEKIFDSFAVGAVPVYFASNAHSVFKLVPDSAMINLFGHNLSQAVDSLKNWDFDLQTAGVWLECVAFLRDKFADNKIIHAERSRIIDALIDELHRF